MMTKSTTNHARAVVTMAKPLYTILNMFILLNVHSFQTNAAASSASSSSDVDDTALNNTYEQKIISSVVTNSATEFLNRMQKNGVDNISLMDFIFCACVILLGFELISAVVLKLAEYFRSEKTIPVRGKHLDDLSSTDKLFISLNKVATVPFFYMMVKFMYHEQNAIWRPTNISLKNTILPLPAIFVIYDFFYTILHWALHMQAVYSYIHKHHHRQKAPSRGNVDAVNVHPVEFFLGEYNHLFAVYIYTNLLGLEFHVVGLILFFVFAATLTGLNHSRYDSTVRVFGVTLYDSKWHDVHHRIPQSNYGQYINLWDLIFGSFRAYNSDDRVNPMAQLDPSTGKSLEYGKKFD